MQKIGTNDTAFHLFELTGGMPTWLEAGFLFQPFSRLGDGGGTGDSRAGTLNDILCLGQKLGSLGFMLKFVRGAGTN